MRTLLLALSALMLADAHMFAAEIRFQSGPEQTSLVELYTSEGCSSCPPAEAWLSRQKESPALWKQFVPLAFHVDYWDRLGWRDRFSSKQWTKRQSRYAALWGNGSLYTPAVVVNGREERRWSGTELSQPNEEQAGLLSVATSEGEAFAIAFQPGRQAAAAYDLHLALLISGISTKVQAGENGGRNLAHDFVVLDLRDAELTSVGDRQQATLTIPTAAEAGARTAVAAWVTARGQLVPLQAAGGWIP